ncbi:RagB/SusD family nutrient uptake outer membrane protein [Sphingobacterium deserti]|uniref:RagB/SusD domain protein n=1 Tax=Sphingobacterium deserti TaxID=1229276 RepID=A0A0B8T2T7_9SPHI|nr:RagB/SusD family nutrient uptake outer membrane protein [Sphingobacterium deserti]KGE15672.1 RagB/SusD domain protein [Sphingobacterium deserti]
MKNIKIQIIAVLLLFSTGCQNFLNVEPKDSLSGNNFWQDINDAETFMLEIYRQFRIGIGIERPTMLVGDFRNSPVVKTQSFPNRMDIPMIAEGQIRTLINVQALTSDGADGANSFWAPEAAWNKMDDWTPAYRVIQSANILYEKVPEIAISDPSISENIVRRYQAEAVFMRCVTYYLLLRHFGDVPYYTNAYNQDPLPRTNHIEVAKRCIAELKAIKDDLPWTYEDPTNRGVRANRGGVLALMMHLNMWCAGFEEGNAVSYYQTVDSLGDELILTGVQQEGAYELLPITRSAEIFNGRSREGLFEIPTNPNYQDPNSPSGTERIERYRRHFVGHVLHAPYFALNQDRFNSEAAFEPDYMRKIYPESEPDGRIEAWFRSRPEMYEGEGSFLCFKFFNFAFGEENTEQSVGYYQIVFRLAESILLQAEALAALGQDDKATSLLNMVRSRANAGLYPASNNYDNNLADAIFWERCKELMGEGHYYYDLVRTKRLLDSEYCWHTMPYSVFLQEAWTWPIHPKALSNNPFMRLNEYWR